MSELKIGSVISTQRRNRGITQEELAQYIGVSKASVSKWETGQSYPDVVFLPQLATYFNISIDELLGYSPQMTSEDIRRLYQQLANAFSIKSFSEVYMECEYIIKKYYSCFPLLLQMSVLLLNHYTLAENLEMQRDVLQTVIKLSQKIKSESEDVWISKQANSIEAVCRLLLDNPEEVLELLEGTIRPYLGDEILLANAYQMTGQLEKSKEVLQISLYQHLIAMIGIAPSYLTLYMKEPERFEVFAHRIITVVETFSIEKLHPNTTLALYLTLAQGYELQGNRQKALDALEKYTDICMELVFPIALHGDSFFDKIDDWFETKLDLGTHFPRDEKTVKASLLNAILDNPTFVEMENEPRFINIIDRLKRKLGVD